MGVHQAAFTSLLYDRLPMWLYGYLLSCLSNWPRPGHLDGSTLGHQCLAQRMEGDALF